MSTTNSDETEAWLPTGEQLKKSRREFVDEYVMNEGTTIFQNPYGSGYWLCGIEYDANGINGWLAYEFGGDHDPIAVDHAKAIEEWGKGIPPVAPYFRLDREFGERAFGLACRKWGEEWIDNVDLSRVDELLQGAMFGELRYG